MDNQRNMLYNKALNLDKHRSVPRNRLFPTLPQDSEMLIPPQPNNEKGKRTHCRWDDDMVKNLVEIMVEIVTTCGKRSDNGNKKDVYLAVANEMKIRGFDVDKDNVANKLKAMKKEYNVAVETKRKSGFEFDTVRKVIVADPLAWAGWVKERPAARNLRTKWLQYFDECELIFGNDYATGSGQFAVGDSRSESEIGESEIGMENTSVDVDDTEVDHVPCQTSNTSTSNGGAQKTNGETQKTVSNVNKRKRNRTSSDDAALLVMQKMVDVTEKIGRALERPSMKDLNEALKAVPNLEKKHVRKAYNILGKDQQLAEMFFGCDLEERKEWVLEILGEEE